ncbi:uncharacterized protein LOC141559148 [Sminthopsis crassicaudata]|uniref:uncharacterized protein LOC141559148 n=1 Tax=Sminthopsis crassicaudata TaxID=9301 RepID=UPI003D68267C
MEGYVRGRFSGGRKADQLAGYRVMDLKFIEENEETRRRRWFGLEGEEDVCWPETATPGTGELGGTWRSQAEWELLVARLLIMLEKIQHAVLWFSLLRSSLAHRHWGKSGGFLEPQARGERGAAAPTRPPAGAPHPRSSLSPRNAWNREPSLEKNKSSPSIERAQQKLRDPARDLAPAWAPGGPRESQGVPGFLRKESRFPKDCISKMEQSPLRKGTVWEFVFVSPVPEIIPGIREKNGSSGHFGAVLQGSGIWLSI